MKKLLALAMALTLCLLGLAACKPVEEIHLTQEEQNELGQALADQLDKETEELLQSVDPDELLQGFTSGEDLAGSWEDEIGGHAVMDAIKQEDGSYKILISWHDASGETAIWEIHGSFDPASGMLAYEDGAYSLHTWDENDNETVSHETTTQGVLMKEGDKLRWQDTALDADALFVKSEG